MSFAIIETGGKQYKVTASKILEIEKLNARVGETIKFDNVLLLNDDKNTCLLYTSPSPRDLSTSRMPSSA